MKKMIFALVLLGLVLTVCPWNKSPVPEELVRGSVFIETPQGTGSGFLRNRGRRTYVVTADHVIATARFHQQTRVHQLGKSCLARPWLCSPAEDIAVLTLSDNEMFPDSVKVDPRRRPSLGKPVYHLGSPAGAAGANSFLKGHISYVGRLWYGNTFDQLDCPILGGCSGGAVTDTDGYLLGMVTLGNQNTYRMGMMVPLRRLLEWAKQENINWLFDDREPVPETVE